LNPVPDREAEAEMPLRRQFRKGSFGGHFDELVQHFPEQQSERGGDQPNQRSAKLQEKIDIHALLFERAWGLDHDGMDRGGI
jgi:hypothetical protein